MSMSAPDLFNQRLAVDVQAAQDLRVKMRQDPQAGLKEASRQFESMMLSMLMKSMREAAPQDGPFNSDASRFYTSMLDQQMAQNLAGQNGGLGLAKMIEQQLSRQSVGRTAQATPLVDLGATSTRPLVNMMGTAAAASEASAASGVAGGVGNPELQEWATSLLRQRAARLASRAPQAEPAAAAASAAAAPAPVTSTGNSSRDFVQRLMPHAVAASQQTGVPAQFMVAQAALESGWGKSEVRSPDGSPTYNLFGVKAGKSWQGATVSVPTTEYINGVRETRVEKFRAYGSYAEAFADYSSLITKNPRFASVVGQQDGTTFARSLQQAGYATDPRYADKLASIINGPTLRQALIG